MIDSIESFGRYPKVHHKKNDYLFWRNENPDFSDENSFLPFGLGKSYGDSCLNPDNNLISINYLNKFISFDDKNGILEVESGVTLEQCIAFLIPRGWFLPVTPGTKLITIGGAIANDVHGKNHHVAGTFGCHIISFELLRSDLSRTYCSREQNTELFNATIGGLGLTGIITKVKFQCTRCNGPMIDSENIKFRSFEEFFEVNAGSSDYEFTVAWVNTNSDGSGILSRGNFADANLQPEKYDYVSKSLPFPVDYDFINPLSVAAFNFLYYTKQLEDRQRLIIDYNPFFYPLDAVNGWNKAYGKRGFLQYQFVIPFENGLENLKSIFKIITAGGNSSFLTVLKTFGGIKSPGMLSFPKPGITMAIDFKMTGQKILDILDLSDKIVRDAGGILYPAKDARMSGEDFRYFYPQWKEFKQYIDPKFSSGFWRRVTGDSK
ncbi:MAG: FAD-binding oxidoreductase [Candidatus Kapabacteria bacterium]|nr:FAD-binding oxidoreductase [Ignavibacteriota bacterium]MCW5885042.1 FAD-binding oxidoreductase [Candidatus Kapabacteria bacterium]